MRKRDKGKASWDMTPEECHRRWMAALAVVNGPTERLKADRTAILTATPDEIAFLQRNIGFDQNMEGQLKYICEAWAERIARARKREERRKIA